MKDREQEMQREEHQSFTHSSKSSKPPTFQPKFSPSQLTNTDTVIVFRFSIFFSVFTFIRSLMSAELTIIGTSSSLCFARLNNLLVQVLFCGAGCDQLCDHPLYLLHFQYIFVANGWSELYCIHNGGLPKLFCNGINTSLSSARHARVIAVIFVDISH